MKRWGDVNLSESSKRNHTLSEEVLRLGKVYVAAKNMRGAWAERPPGVTIVDVTSAQGKASKNRRDFSPMTDRAYEGFLNFEAWWQSAKVFEGVPRERSLAWWRGIQEPKRRYPGSKGKKVLHADFGHGTPLNYIDSRIQQYVPKYNAVMVETEMGSYWLDQVQKGQDVVIYDFDGPRLPDGTPNCLEVTLELLREKLHYERHPFGHGYVVAAHLAGIPVEAYCF
jgi:hypothetical protein